MKFNVFLYVLGLVSKSSLSQIRDPNDVNCSSCTGYQKGVGNVPEGRKLSCKSGSDCSNDDLMLFQKTVGYGVSECTELGIFPDSVDDSNFYVCMTDGGAGFVKYEFTCSEGYFFDSSGLVCVPRSLTSVAFNDSISSSTSVGPTSSSSTDSPTSSPSTVSPTSSSSTDSPTSSPSTVSPTSSPSTVSPTSSPSTVSPTSSPSTVSPTSSPSTVSPTSSPSTVSPTSSPSTVSPTSSPSTVSPTSSSSTDSPTSSPPTVSPTSSPSTVSPTSSTASFPTELPPFSCPSPGIFPHPTNCKMYYRCSTVLKVFYYICPGNSYFNENILKCSMIITPSCQEQILKNLTSTTSTVESTLFTTTTPASTASTESTATTATTTPTPLTTNPPLPTQFSCPGAGTFSNPSDCKIYYKCSSSGKIFRYVCPGNSFFNELTNRCSLVLTPRCKNLIST